MGSSSVDAALLGVKVFIQSASEVLSGSVRFYRLLTDNRSNGSVLTRLSTTKHPLAAITMELASVLKENPSSSKLRGSGSFLRHLLLRRHDLLCRGFQDLSA